MSEATLVLGRDAIARLVSAGAYTEAMRTAFLQLASGRVEAPAVGHFEALEGAFHVKTAVRTVPPRRAVVKVNGNFPDNARRFGLPVIQGVIALLDAERGSVLALMDSIEITARRTAATSALAAGLLARADSRHLALIGCGVQARHHLEAFGEAFELRSVALYDISAARGADLARLAQTQGLVARVCGSVAETVRSADLIVTTTPSRGALLHAVGDGCFIAAVGADSPGKQELDPHLLRRARVVPDVLAQAEHMGDLQHAFAAGLMTARDVHGELSDVVAGRVPGRRGEDEVFVFDSTGTAVADLAAAELVYERARRLPDCLRVPLNG